MWYRWICLLERWPVSAARCSVQWRNRLPRRQWWGWNNVWWAYHFPDNFNWPIQISSFAFTGCGNTYDAAPNGLLYSVSFPYPYPSEMECVYLISQGPGTYIQAEFLFFHTEGDGLSCDQSDFLEIRDGDSPNSPLFGRFCGDLTHAPTYVQSRSNHLWMKWVTVRTLSLPYSLLLSFPTSQVSNQQIHRIWWIQAKLHCL